MSKDADFKLLPEVRFMENEGIFVNEDYFWYIDFVKKRDITPLISSSVSRGRTRTIFGGLFADCIVILSRFNCRIV